VVGFLGLLIVFVCYFSAASTMSDSESEPEDDPRIMKVLTYSDSHTAEETSAYVKELGGDDAIIYGDLCVGKALQAQAFFVVMGAACFDEENLLGPQLEKKKNIFKAYTKGESADLQAAVLQVLELWCVKECRASLEEFGPALKILWENDIIEEDVIMSWHSNERALCEAFGKFFEQADAESIRESSREFIEWVQQGED
jgi:hypothetical protein